MPTTPLPAPAELPLHRWALFAAIARAGSLSRAGLLLQREPSLLSRQLAALERDCGLRLFHRTGRGVVLSEAGTALMPRVAALLEEAAALSEEVGRQRLSPAATVTLGMLPSLSRAISVRLVERIQSACPGVRLHVLEGTSGQVEGWIAQRRIDLGLAFRFEGDDGGPGEELGWVSCCLVGPPGDGLTAGGTLDFRRLHQLPIVLPLAPNGLLPMLHRHAARQGVQLRPVLEADSLAVAKAWVAARRGYTILPRFAVHEPEDPHPLQGADIVAPVIRTAVVLLRGEGKSHGRTLPEVAAQVVALGRKLRDEGFWEA